MDLVVDANILFASLIKDSATAHLLFVDDFHLFAPEYLLEEFEKYKDHLLKKTHRTEFEFHQFIEVLRGLITFIPYEEIKTKMAQAEKITPDIDDSPYFALALHLGASIWSNDKKLKEQNAVDIFSTGDLINFLLNDN